MTELIHTSRGDLDAALLDKRAGTEPAHIRGQAATVAWTEYWLDGELVHRSATIAPASTEPERQEDGHHG